MTQGVLVTAMLACLAVAGPARATPLHATLRSSEPAAGAVLPSAPTRLRLVFTEPVERVLSRISLVTAGGDTIALTATIDSSDVHALVAPVPPLGAGAYRVLWRIVSADGHPIQGNFGFRVTATATADTVPPAADTVPAERADSTGGVPAAAGVRLLGAPIALALLEFAGIGALMALAGLLIFLARLEPRALLARRAALWLAVAAPVALAAHAYAWVATVAPEGSVNSASIGAALATSAGKLEALRLALSVLALWALALARRPPLAAVFAGAGVLASGALGHPMALHPLLNVPAKAVHLGAGSVWLGGLLWLVMRAREASAESFRREASVVSSTAFAAVIAVLISGAAASLLTLPSPLDLFRSGYGALTLAKVVGLLLLVAFGAYHRRTLLPRLAESGVPTVLSRSLTREIAVMLLVIVLGALLANVPPPPDAKARVSPPPPTLRRGTS